MNYSRNPRFNHQSEQASESALVSRNTETEKNLGCSSEPPIILYYLKENSLSAAMLSLYESLLPTKESHDKREMFAKKIEKILDDEWPGKGIKVHMFGSSMNELGTTQSDVDLCVTHATQWNELKNIFKLSNCLERHGMKIEQTVHKAKVPIVRLSDPKLDLACDINVNNTLALHNTRLIRKYVSIDPRVRPLAMVVKYWARRRVLNDAAKGGTISTYTWTCIILNFLQMRNPPILPVLHKIPHDDVEPIMVNGEDASFFENVETLLDFGSSNNESVGGLLFAFFRRMAYEFDYEHHVISLRQGKYLTKAEKGWDKCKGWKMLCVEEPFNTSRNLGNSADDISVNGLREEFRRAYKILYENACLEKLCEEYRFPNQNNNNCYYPQIRNTYNNKRGHKRNFNIKTSSPWNGVKSFNNRKYLKFHQQNNMIDNYDMNGKGNYSRDPQEEDGSSMRRFDNASLNSHYIAINDNECYYENNDGPTRKQFDNIQIRRQTHCLPKEDVQPFLQSRHKNHLCPIKKKNDDHFNNYGQSQNSDSVYRSRELESEEFTRHSDITSNQNQFVYKNNNQKADISAYQKNVRSYPASRFHSSDQKSSYSQNTSIFYDSDNKYNNNYGYSHRSNTPSDSDPKSFVAYNQSSYKYLNKQRFNSRQLEDSSSSSVISSHSKPIIDDLYSNSNFVRSNPAQILSQKSSHRPNGNNKTRNFNKHTPSRQFQKPTENVDLTYPYNCKIGDSSIPSNSISPPNGSLTVTISIQNDPIYSANPNHDNGLLSSNRQPNDGSANYQRRSSHQSSSDGSNSQTSGNTSNTSYSNSSNYTKNNYQKNNNSQNSYHHQQSQNKPSSNYNGFNSGKKKKIFNTYVNGFNNSGIGNSRLNNNTNNSSPAIASNYNVHEMILNAPSHMNQGNYMAKANNDYSGSYNKNGHKVHNHNGGYNNNFKSYNSSNNSNIWKNSNGHNNTSSKITSGNNNTNGPKSANCCNNFFNRGVNCNNTNNNYSRSNLVLNNNNNNNSRNQINNNANSHKLVNGNNYKSVDGNNNSNVQIKNFNSNNNYSNLIKNGGNNQNYNKKNRVNCKIRKSDCKEDGICYQQQYSQDSLQERQNNYNIQSQQQKKLTQNGQNNNNGKGKGGSKKCSNSSSYLKQNVDC